MNLAASGIRVAPPNEGRVSRRALARARVPLAHAALRRCHLCEHHCGVDRSAGQRGLCHAGPQARVFSAQVEVSDELQLIPVFAIALSGCDLRCDFCITGSESWNPRAGQPLLPEEIARRAADALDLGCRSIMILGGEPTIHLPGVLEIVANLPDDATLIWKTNAHASTQARSLLEGLFDIWLADYKFGNDSCAQRLSGTPDYTRIVRQNLDWAARHSELIVRHLLMPGHLECCWTAVAQWIATELPGVKANLRCGFWPAWQAARHQELRGPVAVSESERAWEMAQDLGLNLIA
ncbi:MAG: hypothetical protein DME25_21925 [Verrucomicrobia bacterium]|nr:MAG: hypothetical protein DME25_21925 [Verrucomicrobiota bacterium]